MGAPRELAEAALAHVVEGVEGAYQRSDLYDRRRALMQQWADYVMKEREALSAGRTVNRVISDSHSRKGAASNSL